MEKTMLSYWIVIKIATSFNEYFANIGLIWQNVFQIQIYLCFYPIGCSIYCSEYSGVLEH